MTDPIARLRYFQDLTKRHRQRRILSATVRSTWIHLSIHLFLLTLLSWISLQNPLSTLWLRVLGFSYFIYLGIPLVYWIHKKAANNQLASVAEELDRANVLAPDPFRTCLSLENHTPSTQAELNLQFSNLMGTLILPKVRFFLLKQRILLSLASLVMVAMAFVSQQPSEFFYRAVLPWQVLGTLPNLKFSWQQPRLILGVGDTVKIHGTVQHALAGQSLFAYVQKGSQAFRFPLTMGTDGQFEFFHGPVMGNLILHFAGDNGRSSQLDFQVRAPPYLKKLQVILSPPLYTRLKADTLPRGLAHFSVLPGTRVTWVLESDRRLQELRFEMQALDSVSKVPKPQIKEIFGPGIFFQPSSEVRVASEYSLDLEDEDGIRSQASIPNRIDLIPDLPPEIQLLSPDADTTLSRDFKLPLAFRLKDDFGISGLKITYRILKEGRVRAEGQKEAREWLKASTADLIEVIWDLGSLQIQAQEELEFHLVALDNDTVNGPKATKTEVRRLRLASLQEVLAAIRQRDQRAETSLKSALQREKQLERKLEREKQGPREDGPPVLAEYEINRIMVDDPQDHLQRLAATLANLKQPAARELQEALKQDAQVMPQGNQGFLPLEEKQKNLDELIKIQKQQAERLARVQEKLSQQPEAKANASAKANLDELAKELQRNLGNQTDLQKQMEDKIAEMKTKSDMMDQAIQEQMKMAQDMQSAAEDIQKSMQQGAKDGLLSPELLEKMKKIDELMREVLPDSLRQMLEKKVSGQEVNPEELQKQLKQLLEKQAELSENLNRALAMLEQLKDRKRMQELKQVLAELKAREEALENSLKTDQASASEHSAIQKAIQKEAHQALAEFDAQAATRKGLDEINKKLDSKSIQKDMQDVREALGKISSEAKSKRSEASLSARSAAAKSASKSAASAAAKLGAMQESLDEAMAGMENSVDLGEAQDLLQESMALSRLQMLIRSGSAQRREQGWEAEEAILYGKVAQTAQWLNERIKGLAAKVPFLGSALMSAARNLSLTSREASQQYTWELGEQSLKHNQNLSRELLKLLKMAQGGGGQGGGSGSGSGSSSNNPGGSGQGEGQGKSGDLSGQLKGMSGKQMAINQATYQLLRSMLEGRQTAGQAGGKDGRSKGGQQEGQHGGQQGGQQSGNQDGSSGGEKGGSSVGQPGSETLPGMANQQGELGEGLESLAEKLAEEGTGSQKLRGLADQARKLEDDLRQGRISPEELRMRQERFQSRLLEAANAMEERGQSEMRQAETSSKPIPGGTVEQRQRDETRLMQMLREARRSAKSLSLSEAQKKYLDEYYESLLTR